MLPSPPGSSRRLRPKGQWALPSLSLGHLSFSSHLILHVCSKFNSLNRKAHSRYVQAHANLLIYRNHLF